MELENLPVNSLVMHNHHIIIIHQPCLAQHRMFYHLQRKWWFLHHTMIPRKLQNSSQIPAEIIIHHLPLLSFHTKKQIQHQIRKYYPICLWHSCHIHIDFHQHIARLLDHYHHTHPAVWIQHICILIHMMPVIFHQVKFLYNWRYSHYHQMLQTPQFWKYSNKISRQLKY